MKVRSLLQAYFVGGGNQLQINVIDKEALQKGLKELKKNKNIIVRIGGFSDNFILLDSKIQEEIIKCIKHN